MTRDNCFEQLKNSQVSASREVSQTGLIIMLGVLKLPTHMQGFLHPLGKRELRMIRNLKLIIDQETVESTATSANLKQLWTAHSWKVNFKISFLNTTVYQENHLSIIITPVNQAASPSGEWRTHRRNQREAADRRVLSRDKCSRGIVSRSGDSLLLTVTRVKHEIHHHPREYHHNLQPLLTSLRTPRKIIKGEKMVLKTEIWEVWLCCQVPLLETCIKEPGNTNQLWRCSKVLS